MTDYYVRSSGGSDGNAGTSFAAAWATIGKAILAASVNAGDRIIVCADGTHLPTSTVTWDGTSEAGTSADPILMVGGNGTTGAIDGTIATISGASLGGGAHLFQWTDATKDNWIFQNLRLTAAPGNNLHAGVDASATCINCEIDNAGGHGAALEANAWRFVDCNIHDNTTCGITTITATAGVGSWFVFNSAIHHNGSHGVNMRGNANSFHYSLLYRNGGDGIRIEQRHGTLVVNGCIFALNTGDGLGNSGSTSLTGTLYGVTNSIFYQNGAYGFSFVAYEPDVDITVLDRNCYFGNTTAATDFTLPGSADITEDPLFTNTSDGSEDFTLQSASPCRGVGYGTRTA